METLSISKENALKAYDNGSEKTKKLLNELFGENVFIRDIKERIKTFGDACEYLGIDEDQFLSENARLDRDEIAYKKLKIIVQALNEGVVMNYKDTSEYKYYPWFNAVGSGPGFSYFAYFYGRSASTVGSRLCLKTSALAKYAGTQFLDIYNDFINA